VIDLHLHTTASDGRSSPEQLVHEAREAGLTTIAVTDHDTTAAVSAVMAVAATLNIETVAGIEITAVHGGRDVHMLAYFLDPHAGELAAFLARQREDRRRRVVTMLESLERLGLSVDQTAIRERASGEAGRAIGRPMVAEALMRAGHVRSIAEAFDRFLAEGRPAYVPRRGAPPHQVLALVAGAGGLTSLAHPGKLRRDEIIPELVEAGLAAIEVHHPDHDPLDVNRYRRMAESYGLLVTGGSDYHGPGSGRTAGLGRVTLPREDFDRLADRAGWPGRSV
jgi:predicted metal-dependent phosphoesterase TrpH